MSLKQRAEMHRLEREGRSEVRATRTGGNDEGMQAVAGIGMVTLFPYETWAIVDDDIALALGTFNNPGHSLSFVLQDPDEGHVAPVSYGECRIFRNLNRAALQQLLQAEQRSRQRTGGIGSGTEQPRR
jgi:hypothetical protein